MRERFVGVDPDSMLSEELIAERREEAERDCRQARERSLKRLREGFDLGTAGERTWSRDELHER